jgi:two-component system phosphate regulon response regulator OmpR
MVEEATQVHILVVDDDARIRQMLARYFEDEGFQVSAVADGRAMRAQLEHKPVDLILLDLVLPGEDGLSLAREIRSRSNTPIIMLTGRDDVVDKVVGLEVGADDYIGKPFHLREVLARVKTVLRRHKPASAPAAVQMDAPIRFDGYAVDIARRQLLGPDGEEVTLTTGEFDMLAVMIKRPGHVFTRETLMEQTRGRQWDVFDRTIDAQIARLRKKLDSGSTSLQLIKSVRGVGYVFTGKIRS